MSDPGFIPDNKLPTYTPDKLRTIRKRELGLTQERLAEKVRCDPKKVQRYESGVSRIPPEFIRTIEKLRGEEPARRARELGADKVDLSNANIPGLELIELIPNAHVRELVGKLARMFVAVPKEWLAPSAEGGQPPPSPAPDSGSSPSGRHRPSATSVSRAEFWMGLAGMACLCFVILGAVILLRSDIRSALYSPRGVRVARDAKVERPATPPATVHEQKTPDATDEREPEPVPQNVYTDGASDGSMPKKPYSWQKVGPCEPGEDEKNGGCWWEMDAAKFRPPCPSYAVESENRCFVPAPAKPKRPNTVTPKK